MVVLFEARTIAYGKLMMITLSEYRKTCSSRGCISSQRPVALSELSKNVGLPAPDGLTVGVPEGTATLPGPDSITTSVVRRSDAIAVLTVAGEVDMRTAPELQIAVDRVAAEGPKALIVDLSEVTFMSSIGIRILAALKERLGQTAGFAVVASRAATRRPIEVTGLSELLSLHLELDEAVTTIESRAVQQNLMG